MNRRTIWTKTIYLEMWDGPPAAVAEPVESIRIELAVRPSLVEYRSWYQRVGSAFYWVDRLMMADETLRKCIHDPLVEIYLLLVADELGGYAELDRRQANQIELAYFGLFPEFCGRGLGRYFLNWSVRKAWSYQPERVWLHTCDLDHPAALPNYLKAGFQIYDQTMIEQVIDIEPQP